MEKQLLNVNELSLFLNIKKSKIYDMVYRRRIPFTKIGNQLRFRRELIDDWIKNKTHIPFDLKKWYNKPQVEGEEVVK